MEPRAAQFAARQATPHLHCRAMHIASARFARFARWCRTCRVDVVLDGQSRPNSAHLGESLRTDCSSSLPDVFRQVSPLSSMAG